MRQKQKSKKITQLYIYSIHLCHGVKRGNSIGDKVRKIPHSCSIRIHVFNDGRREDMG